MKQNYAVKLLLLIALFGAGGSANGQTWHPYAFDTILSSSLKVANWYKNYVGERLEVTSPLSIAGDKIYTTANDGSGGAGQWGGVVTTPLVNIPIYMDTTSDSFGHNSNTPLSPAAVATINSTTPHMIVCIWRGPLGSGAVDFACKAKNAEMSGASAVVIINEYPGQGPVGMGIGTTCSPSTIPVFMIGNLDGIAISAQYRSGVPVRMTITPWGQNYLNDLGFVPGGHSVWHDYAIPSIMLGGENPIAYKSIHGAFVANFGTHLATNVKVKSSLTFTPTGGSPGVAHVDSNSLASFPAADSIWAIFSPNLYDLLSISTTGRYDLTYNITADTPDQFTFDNNLTHSFYATDSVFSKGRYDLANNHVITSQYFRVGGNYLWGVPYYITRGGDAFKDVQFSVSGAIGALPSQTQTFYIFKWTDGSVGGSLDSSLEGAELKLVGLCTKQFNGTSDSSFGYFTTDRITADTSGTGALPVKIDSNSWYYVAAEVAPISSTQFMYLGCDGVLDMYPRSFGLKHFHNITELYNPALDTDKTSMRLYYQNAGFSNFTFGGGSASIDSIVYNSQVGLIPNLALRITPYVEDHTNVKPSAIVATKFEVFPNPASDYVNVNMEFANTIKDVTYTIVNTHAKVVNKETHNNVKSDMFTYSTSNLATGNYFIIVNADGKQMFKKFTMIK